MEDKINYFNEVEQVANETFGWNIIKLEAAKEELVDLIIDTITESSAKRALKGKFCANFLDKIYRKQKSRNLTSSDLFDTVLVGMAIGLLNNNDVDREKITEILSRNMLLSNDEMEKIENIGEEKTMEMTPKEVLEEIQVK